MSLVVHNGTQYDSDRLPKHVNPKDCVPIDEWFKKNRVTGAAKKPAAPAAKKQTATASDDAKPKS